jgi:hypothetical protein
MTRQKSLRIGVLTVSLILITASLVWAAVTTIPNSALTSSNTYYTDGIGGGIGTPPIAANDDGSSGAINLGFTLNFFGVNYTQFFANNNGNITFAGPLGAFTPSGPQGASQPIISPYFADVDSRGGGSGLMSVRTDVPNEVIITWDRVGYYFEHTDKLDSFQLVLRGPGFNVPAGEGQVGFFYKTMQWEVGDASGGVGGFCPGGTVGISCFPAAVGFGDGNASGFVLAASLQAGISAVVNNSHVWFGLVNGVPTAPGPGAPAGTPAPATWVLLATGMMGLLAYQWLRMKRQQS